MVEQVNETKKKRLRSPGYPFIDLKESIDRATKLWGKDKHNAMSKEVACKHLGYTNAGGYAGRIIASLKHFGLTKEANNGIILTQEL